MADKPTHINYSFEDIQRYLQGKMSSKEMYDVEKAALQDPFLAEAIEGYTTVDAGIAAQHLNQINAGIFAEKKESKVVSFNKRTQWLNVAAAVIVLAGIGLVVSYFVRPSSSNQNSEIAKVQQAPVSIEDSSNIIVTDSLNIAAKKADSNLLIAGNARTPRQRLEEKKKTENVGAIASNEILLNKAEADSFKTDIASAKISAAPPLPEKITMSRPYSAALAPANADSPALQEKAAGFSVLPTTFLGKVVDENNNPIAGVTIASANNKKAVFTDANGYFSLQKTDTLLHITASAVGFSPHSTALRQGDNNLIILKQNIEGLNEVAVVGYGAKRKKNVFTTDSILRNQRKVKDGSAMPVGGWGNFNNYVLTQLNKDTTTSAITNPGDIVELEFLIDNAGNPYDIKIIQSPNETYSTKAVEILKTGPKWTQSSHDKKAKVEISF